MSIEVQINHLYDSVTFGTYSIAADGGCSSVNSQVLGWLDCARDSILGKRIPSEPKAIENWRKLNSCSNYLYAEGLDEIELELTEPSGNQRCLRLLLRKEIQPNNYSQKYRTLIFDTTEYKKNNERLQIDALAFESKIGVCITDQHRHILESNRSFSNITGYASEDLRGKSLDLFLSLRLDAVLDEEILDSLAAKGKWEGEIRSRQKDGTIYYGWVNISQAPMNSDLLMYYVVYLYDITTIKASQEVASRLVYYDFLTELPNRRMLNERLAQALAITIRSNLRGALLFIDIDNFKYINDTKGHAAGDLLLIEVGQRLKRTLRAGDTVARVGGDEFVVLLAELNSDLTESSYQAHAISSKILESLRRPYSIDDFIFNCSASIGIAMFGKGDIADEIFQNSDMAMYKAKSEGKNALRFFDPLLKESISNYSILEQDLRRAVELDQLELYFQPQFDCKGHILSAEALLRWHHPVRGLLKPGEFIDIAEKSGLIVPIGLWVMQNACAQLKRWESDLQLCGLIISINVSGRQFQEPDFLPKTLEVIESSLINPSLMQIELTESMMHNIEASRTKMEKIRELGVRFSLDDFGTGFSSLTNLSKLPVAQLKIDISFIKNMLSIPNDRVIVTTIIAMASGLHMEVVAEGVETESERNFLYSLGCFRYQGYLMSPPLPIREFTQLVKNQGDGYFVGSVGD